VIISGTGRYLPERVLTNEDFEKMPGIDTSDEWIRTRTGIRERRVVDNGMASSDLAVRAARIALKRAGKKPEDLDLVIISTITPDTFLPSCACWVQDRLGARNAGAFDVTAACSGFIYGVSMAAGFIGSGAMRTVLVVGSECLTKITDYSDRSSCILFGDGAGAAILEASEDEDRGLIGFKLGADGSGGEYMITPGGGSRMPPTHASIDRREHYMKIKGREVFKFAVNKMVELVKALLKENNLTINDLKLIIPHQVNYRILSFAAKKLRMPLEKMYINIDRYGNTSAASIPIALDEAVEKGLIEKGDLIAFVAFGGGLTWGSCLIRW
jgi:3-oxoacyl-[acyl-carrier-protein] synthase-3